MIIYSSIACYHKLHGSGSEVVVWINDIHELVGP